MSSLDPSVFHRDGLGLRTKGIVGTEFEHGSVAFYEDVRSEFLKAPGVHIAGAETFWSP